MDSQGPTPGMAPNTWLSLESPLYPFEKPDGQVYTSMDCINIEKQLGYTYGPGSLETPPMFASNAAEPRKAVQVAGINRADIRGSVLVSAFATIDGKKSLLGTEAVLSRWNVQGCMNCQAHLETKAMISLHGLGDAALNATNINVEVRTRDGALATASALAALGNRKKPFRLEVR